MDSIRSLGARTRSPKEISDRDSGRFIISHNNQGAARFIYSGLVDLAETSLKRVLHPCSLKRIEKLFSPHASRARQVQSSLRGLTSTANDTLGIFPQKGSRNAPTSDMGRPRTQTEHFSRASIALRNNVKAKGTYRYVEDDFDMKKIVRGAVRKCGRMRLWKVELQ